MYKSHKFRASDIVNSIEKQLPLGGIETHFAKSLQKDNRCLKLKDRFPWDTFTEEYIRPFEMRGLEPSDRDTIKHIQENIYMQYFLGSKSFRNEPPFVLSLFVDLRKRCDMDRINEINEFILGL